MIKDIKQDEHYRLSYNYYKLFYIVCKNCFSLWDHETSQNHFHSCFTKRAKPDPAMLNLRNMMNYLQKLK